MIDGGVNIITVGNDGEGFSWLTELRHHIFIGFIFMRPSPACDRAMLGGGNAEPRHWRMIQIARRKHASQRIGAAEIDQMREAAQRRAAIAGDAPSAEIVQRERQFGGRIVGCPLQRFLDRLAHMPANRRDRRRIPDAQQRSFDIAR